MERHQIIEMMRELKLAGMRASFDEILANGLKRQHSIQQIIGDLLQAEIAEKQARSIKYQVAIARLHPVPRAQARIAAARREQNPGRR